MNTTVRVCPTCGEHDDMPQFWSERCERDWKAANDDG